MMLMRRFNAAGMTEFRRVVASIRKEPSLLLPTELLDSSEWTEAVEPTIYVAEQNFTSRRSAASYLHEALASLDGNQIAVDAGLWTWLSAYFFDEICRPSNGERTVKNDYYYVFDPHNIRHSYRHLLYIAWSVLNAAPDHNRLFLDVPLNALDKATADVMKRLYLTRIPCLFEVLDRIYWDESRGKIRSGMVSPNKEVPGDLMHRFPVRIRQLEMTYDLQRLNADQVIELLGDEFQFATTTLSS